MFSNYLVDKHDGYKLLNKAGHDDIAGLIGDAYIDALFNGHELYETGDHSIIAEYVPTAFGVVHNAYDNFEPLVFDLASNGYNEELLDEINHHRRNGIDDDDIILSWMEFREYNNIYSPPDKESYEGDFIHDIVRALNVYHLSHLREHDSYRGQALHGYQDGTYSNSSRNIKDIWQNKPLEEVW